jgi:N-methylhydantoinase A/oxoprolinase/acetone carboxylase beta subunit
VARNRLYAGQGWIHTDVYKREELAADQRIVGPALVVQADATLYLPEDWQGVTDSQGNLRLTSVHERFRGGQPNE